MADLAVPLAWYPRLVQGSPAERQRWQLLGDGTIEWPDLDEHIGVEGLLAGRRSGESARSLPAGWPRAVAYLHAAGNSPAFKTG